MEPSQSSEDIVQELRDWAYITDESQGKAVLVLLSGAVFSNAANEIARLRHQVDRLDAALDDIAQLTDDRLVMHRIKEARRG